MRNRRKYIVLIVLMTMLPQVVEAIEKRSCGTVRKGGINGIPAKIPELLSFFITVAQVATAVILVLMGTLDLFKGLTSGKEEEIKNGQQLFIKRLIVGSLVFFIVLIVKLLIGAIANSSTTNIISCIDCFINNKCNNDTSVAVTNENDASNSEKYISKSDEQGNSVISTTNSTSKKSGSSSKTKNNNSTTNSASKKSGSSSKTKNNNSTTNSTSSLNSSSKAKSQTIFIGDSEVTGMCGEYKLCEGSKYYEEGGIDCGFMETVKSSVNKDIKSKEYNIVIILGFNGALDTEATGAAEAERCFNKAFNLAKNDWKKQNVVYVSLNPCDDARAKANGMWISNTAIKSFNKTMKRKINSSGLSNLSYCDTNTGLNIKEIDGGDGVHYTKAGEQKVYNTIKNKCLK